MLATSLSWTDCHCRKSLGFCIGTIRKFAGLLTILLLTTVLVYRIGYDDDALVSRPHISVGKLTDCSLPPTHKASSPRIPNIVHQMWKDDNISSYPITASVEEWKSSLGPLNYTIKLWTESDVVHLIKTSYPWLLSTYENYPQNIQRADVARLAIVHAEGGIYADLDTFPTSTTDIHCLQRFGYQALFASTSENSGVSNHFFMAEQGSEFLLWALHEAKRRASLQSKHFPLPYLQVMWSTGPLMVTSIAGEYSWAYKYADGERRLVVMDHDYLGRIVHHAAGRSWHGSDGRALNFMADHAEDGKRGAFGVAFLVALFIAYIIVRRRMKRQGHGTIELEPVRGRQR